ncbi:MAG: hypothetical protein Q8P05_02805 [Candidatus Diapherotrites archaeon]|nr:hypothetical protein [Candidatus Diapherotrites archaeon]
MSVILSPEVAESLLLAYEAGGWRPKTPEEESLLDQAKRQSEANRVQIKM